MTSLNKLKVKLSRLSEYELAELEHWLHTHGPIGPEPHGEEIFEPPSEPHHARHDFLLAGLGPDGAPVEGGTPETLTLARFDLSHGNTIEFVGLQHEREGDELGVRELGGGPRESDPTFAPGERLSVSDMYLRLAPEGAPVPEMIAAAHRRRHPDQRATYSTVEFVEGAILVDLDERGLRSAETDSHYCVGGFNAFESDFCDTASFPSNTWWWCDAGAHHFWRDRWTSNHKRRNSLGITAACTAPAATSHYYKNIWGNWKHNKTWHLPPGYWQWTKWEGGSQRDRWIRHRMVTGGTGFFRAVSFFWT